jgi:zinc transporter ZupT
MGRTNKHRSHRYKQKNSVQSPKLKKPFKNSTKVLLTQAALSIHSFFECMSLGIQTDTNTTLTLLLGIAIHKWAEGLTLGYEYKGVNMPK